ncbi:MAG: Gx transporter family protein [Endomicrobiales bacterium]|nr:Gx transporter family protein [Endomicrobiales bacterium]
MRRLNIAQVSFLIACGAALQLAEQFIPIPIPLPGLKIGLANISTLLGLMLFGAPVAFQVAVFRPVLTSIANGTFMSPWLILSFCGSLASFFIMVSLFSLFKSRNAAFIITLSIISAVTHNAAELVVAYYWLIPHAVVFAIAPVLLLMAVVGGYFVGWSADFVYKRIEKEKYENLPDTERTENDPEIGALELKDKVRITAAFILVISTIFWRTAQMYGILISVVLFFMFIYGIKPSEAFKKVSALWPILVFSFLLPVFFSPEGRILFEWKFVRIGVEGLMEGLLFSLRLILLILISVWVGVGNPSEISKELAWILSPLRYFHFAVNRIPRMTSLSLSFLPVVWERISKTKPRTLKGILETLSVFFVELDSNLQEKE